MEPQRGGGISLTMNTEASGVKELTMCCAIAIFCFLKMSVNVLS